MENRFLPSYTIGPDAYDEIPAVCRKFGKTAVIIGGNKARNAAEPLIRKAVEGKISITVSSMVMMPLLKMQKNSWKSRRSGKRI